MLNLLDEGLEAFLRAEVPLARNSIDVSFAAPDKDWGAGVTRPTINLFLWDVRRNLSEREAGMALTGAGGHQARRPPLPRVDCRYLVSAWTSETPDEHALLGAVLATLLSHDEIAVEHLPAPFAGLQPLPSLSVAAADAGDQSDFWSAVGGQLKPGLDLRITATVDAAASALAGPPVLQYDITVGPAGSAHSPRHFVAGADGRPEAVGATVVSPRGSAVISPDGTYLVAAESGDDVMVDVMVDGDPPSRGRVTRSGRLSTGGKR